MKFAPPIYTRVLFFYPNIENDHVPNQDRFERLKTSLSETLTHFYPLAGRVKDSKIIECNDEGAEFCETRAHGFLSDILKQPDADLVPQFVPVDLCDLGSGVLLKVQVNLFGCGSLAIGVSFSHKFADASTIGSFMKAWSCTAVGCMTESMLPKYVLGSLYPSTEFSNDLPPFEIIPTNCITRRYVFDSSKITKLKAEAASQVVDNPTRVEAVLALIWKCATTASRTNLGLTKRRSLIYQLVNIRKRTNPPLPETCVGNFVGFFTIIPEESNNDSEMNLQGRVIHLRKGLEQFTKLLKNEVLDLWGCSSWCHFGFYEVDFGWGRPKWVSIPLLETKNSVVLMDTSDGKGIEALVALSEQDMALMESNTEFIEFASINPTHIK
ncbi:hypothetical protein K1719_026520 [Acacia pycnantha]|nr:hypothetical protein K1719_026520 [Acacia pycnantha]